MYGAGPCRGLQLGKQGRCIRKKWVKESFSAERAAASKVRSYLWTQKLPEVTEGRTLRLVD